MGRVGACADNAAMESIFSLLQKNDVLDRQRWPSRQDLRLAITTYLDRTDLPPPAAAKTAGKTHAHRI
jgi:transposase InsO family protein